MKRKDAVIVNDPDPFHSIIPFIMPKRTEAEVSTKVEFDITDLLAFIKEHNEKEETEYKLFHCICTAVARMIYHRPKLNIFISGRTVIRSGVQLPADDSFYHQGCDPLLTQMAVELQKIMGFHGLEQNLMAHLLLYSQKRRILHLRKMIGSFIDQRQYMMSLRQPANGLPILCSKRILNLCTFATKRSAQNIQKMLITYIHHKYPF